MKKAQQCVAIAIFALTAVSAGAQTVTGSASGCFSSTPFGCVPAAGSVSFGTLTYYSSTFSDVVNSFGIVNFGGNAVASPSNFNNFGSFQLGTAPFTFGNPSAPTEFFTLALMFTSPQTGAILFNAAVTGQVLASSHGGASIDFANNLYQPIPGTSMQARVNDVDINPGLLIAGSGAVNAVPEPSSALLLATGLLGFAGVVRRRKSHQQ